VTDTERADVLLAKIETLQTVMDERDIRYEQRFKAMDEKTSLALTASEKAVAKAEIATEKRFDSVNEFRGQLKDQAATLVPRAEADSRFKGLEEKIESLKSSGVTSSRWTIDKLLMLGLAAVGWIILLFRVKS
jgi:hypothetical protein